MPLKMALPLNFHLQITRFNGKANIQGIAKVIFENKIKALIKFYYEENYILVFTKCLSIIVNDSHKIFD